MLQIFHASCGGSGCHINNAKNGVELTTYSTTMSSTGTQYASLIVVPGSAATSPLIDKIEPSPTHGERMPDGKSALSQTRINAIKQWINEGALNN